MGRGRRSGRGLSLSSRPRARKLLPRGVARHRVPPVWPVGTAAEPQEAIVLVRFGVAGTKRQWTERLADRIEKVFDAFQAKLGGTEFQPSNHELKWTVDENGIGVQHRCICFVLPVRWTVDVRSRTCPEFAQAAEAIRHTAERAGSLPDAEVQIEFPSTAPPDKPWQAVGLSTDWDD